MMNLLFVEVQLMQTLLNERTSVNYSMIDRAAVHLAVGPLQQSIVISLTIAVADA